MEITKQFTVTFKGNEDMQILKALCWTSLRGCNDIKEADGLNSTELIENSLYEVEALSVGTIELRAQNILTQIVERK